MDLTRRGFLLLSLLTLSGCGGSKKDDDKDKDEKGKKKSKKSKKKQETKNKETEKTEEKKEEPKQIVDETTYYDVFRCDWKEGVLGDVEVYTQNTQDFSDSYAVLDPDGTFNFEINGVPYNGHIELGEKTHHLYSGIEDAEVTQLLFDGREDTTVGAVLIQGYYVDEYPLIEMITQMDGKTVFATFYLWKHVDE